MVKLFTMIRAAFAKDFTEAALHLFIVLYSAAIITVSLFIHNKWVLGGIAAYLIV